MGRSQARVSDASTAAFARGDNRTRSPRVDPEYIFWSGNLLAKSADADAQQSFRRLLQLAGVEGHFHMLRDTFAVRLLEKGVPIETVSVLLGHGDNRVTLKHYRPWVKSLQDKLEFEVQKAWAS